VTRIGPQTTAQRAGDVLVIANAQTGEEVSLQEQDAARLAAALPYLLTGATGIADIAAERIRQMRHWTRSHDLQGGPAHAANMLRVSSFYAALAARQVDAFQSLDDTRDLRDLILEGTLQAPQGWPDSWAWDPSVDPARNAAMSAALNAAAMDVLAVVRAVAESQGRG